MKKNIEFFWGEILKNIRRKDIKSLYKTLSGLSEPNETRLGFAVSKKKGNSISKKIKPKLIEAIQKNKAVQTGILSDFADAELFIEDIGPDRISDITTKIIKSELVKFTQDQCNLWGIPMETVKQKDFFNLSNLKWEHKSVELPTFEGKAIIFVPKDIVRLKNSSNSNLKCFYIFAIRKFISNDKDYIQDISPSGKDGILQLKDIKAKYPLSKESLSNWMLKHPKMLVDFKSEKLRERIKPLSDEQITKIIYKAKAID
ncbi:hypothetical protein PG279_05990 [Riemerella anatipestifer]|nr:hypothetical protein [Riemerella anatipestifer]